MKVGAATVDITPQPPFALAGSYHMRMASDILDPLCAQCAVI